MEIIELILRLLVSPVFVVFVLVGLGFAALFLWLLPKAPVGISAVIVGVFFVIGFFLDERSRHQ